MPRWLAISALDAPLIACLWQRYLLQKYQFTGHWLETSLLFLVVWIIYIADRLADAASLAALELSPRHHFYQRYRQPMLYLLFFLLLLAARLSFYLPWQVWLLGLALLLACAVYLQQARSYQRMPKEVSAALLFAGGISLVPWLEHTRWAVASTLLWQDTLYLALLAFFNMGLIALADATTDAQQGQHSLALRYPYWARLWLSLTFVVLLLSFVGQAWLYSAVLMTFLGIYIMWQHGKLSARAVHIAADSALAIAAFLGFIAASM